MPFPFPHYHSYTTKNTSFYPFCSISHKFAPKSLENLFLDNLLELIHFAFSTPVYRPQMPILSPTTQSHIQKSLPLNPLIHSHTHTHLYAYAHTLAHLSFHLLHSFSPLYISLSLSFYPFLLLRLFKIVFFTLLSYCLYCCFLFFTLLSLKNCV